MSSSYPGNPANVSLGTAVAITIPSDGDVRNAASVNPASDKLADYMEALRQFSFSASGIPLNEGFESATFPPVSPLNSWKVPSVNFGADSSWIRTTTSPLVGTASASAPTPQALSTNSSMSLTVVFASPSRLAFVFSVTCNTNSDFLQLFIDGIQFASFTSGAANANKGGRFVSDLLREGPHTFDWRFVRGASASVGGELCKVDTVETTPESSWLADDTRIFFKDDFNQEAPGNSPAGVVINANPYNLGNWRVTGSSANFPTIGPNAALSSSVNLTGSNLFGVWNNFTSGVAVGDSCIQNLRMIGAAIPPTGVTFSYAKKAFIETSMGIGILTNSSYHFGWDDFSGSNPSNGIYWESDPTIGTTWQLRVLNTAVTTRFNTGITVDNTAFHRLGISVSNSPVNSVVFTYDGKSIPVGANFLTAISGLPADNITLNPGYRVKSVTAAQVSSLFIDWFKMLSLR